MSQHSSRKSRRVQAAVCACLAVAAACLLGQPRDAAAVGDLPPTGAEVQPDVLILMDSTANQNSSIASLGSNTNIYLNANGAVKQFHVWQRAMTGDVVPTGGGAAVNTSTAGIMDQVRGELWFGFAGIDQASATGPAQNEGYSYGPSQVASRNCSWTGTAISCVAGAGASVNLGMRNDTALATYKELPFVRLHRAEIAGLANPREADNDYIQRIFLNDGQNPFQGNPDGLIDVFEDAKYYFETDYPSQAKVGCGDKFIIYLGAGVPNSGPNDAIEDVKYLHDTLGVITYVVGLYDLQARAANNAGTLSYIKYMNELALAGGGKCASVVYGSGTDCAFLAGYNVTKAACSACGGTCGNTFYNTNCDVTGAEDLRAKLTTAFAQIKSQVSSRTRAAIATPLLSGANSNWRVNAAFQVNTVGGRWNGKLRATKRDIAGTVTKTLDFHDVLDKSTAPRRVLTRSSSGATLGLSSVLSSDYPQLINPTWLTLFSGADPCIAHAFFDSATEFYKMYAGGTADNLLSADCTAATNADEKQMVTAYSEHRLGGIYHSSPALVTPPELFLNDATYQQFRSDQSKRPLTVYVGANDGMLHAFALEDDTTTGTNEEGTELFGYTPRFLIPSLKDGIKTNQPWVDGAPLIRDVQDERSSSGTSSGWRTVLIESQGRGGAGWFALDVTKPTDTTSYPKSLWEHTSAEFDFTEMGNVYGNAAVGRVFVTNKEIPIAILPGGWVSSTAEAAAGYPTGRVVHIVNLLNGTLLRRFSPNCAGATNCTTVSGLDAPITGTPSAYDDLPTAFTSRTFVGDMKGRMWRIDTTSSDTSKWKMERFWPALTGQYSTAAYQQPIFLPPSLAFDSSRRLVLIYGTGNVHDLDTPESNRVWAIREKLALSAIPGDPPVATSELVWSAPKSLTVNEKLVGDTVIFNNVVLFSTFLQTATVCGFGESRLYALDMTTGAGKFTGTSCAAATSTCTVAFGGSGNAEYVGLGSGVPSAPLIRQTPVELAADASGKYSTTSGTGSYQAVVQVGASTKTEQFADTTQVKDLGAVPRRADILSIAEYE